MPKTGGPDKELWNRQILSSLVMAKNSAVVGVSSAPAMRVGLNKASLQRLSLSSRTLPLAMGYRPATSSFASEYVLFLFSELIKRASHEGDCLRWNTVSLAHTAFMTAVSRGIASMRVFLNMPRVTVYGSFPKEKTMFRFCRGISAKSLGRARGANVLRGDSKPTTCLQPQMKLRIT